MRFAKESSPSAKAAVEVELKKKEAELVQTNGVLEEEQEAGQKKERSIKDLNNKMAELEEEIEVRYSLIPCVFARKLSTIFRFFVVNDTVS